MALSAQFVYHYLLNLDLALHYSYSINDDYWTGVRTRDGNPPVLFPVFDFDGEYFAISGNDRLTSATPIFHIGCDDGAVSLVFSSLTTMMLAIAECYETGVYTVTPDGRITVTDAMRFSAIRQKHNPGTVKSLYIEGW